MSFASSEQLMLLHQELAALSRAGLPLDRGLRQLAADLPGGLGRLANSVAARLERGEPLEEALRACRSPDHRVYAAVIAAGMRSGDLNRALEGIVAHARASGELRRSLVAELLYPAILLLVSFGLLEFSLRKLWPVSALMSERFDAAGGWMAWVNVGGGAWLNWGWLAQLLLGGVAVSLALLLVRGTSLRSGARRGGPLHAYRVSHALARFCDLLALMFERSVPLPEAVALAGEAAGWRPLATAAARTSERLRRGEPVRAEAPVPETVVWLLSSVTADRSDALRREARRYRARAQRQGRWLTTWLPLMVSIAIGISFIVLLAVVNLGPFLNVLFRLSRADN